MATVFYDSPIGYDDALTPYNGNPIIYLYSGSITIMLVPKYASQTAQFYSGMLDLSLLPASSYHKIFLYRPTVGLIARFVPNSSIIIRRYKKVKDPIRVGGCVQCGTYLYDT